jgi:hypothetical protein
LRFDFHIHVNVSINIAVALDRLVMAVRSVARTMWIVKATNGRATAASSSLRQPQPQSQSPPLQPPRGEVALFASL